MAELADVSAALLKSLDNLAAVDKDLIARMREFIEVTKAAEKTREKTEYAAGGEKAKEFGEKQEAIKVKAFEEEKARLTKSLKELSDLRKSTDSEERQQAIFSAENKLREFKKSAAVMAMAEKERVAAIAAAAKQFKAFNRDTLQQKGIDLLKEKIQILSGAAGGVGKDVFKLAGGAELLGGSLLSVAGAGGLAAAIWALSEMFKVVQSGAANASLFAYSGGIMNDAINTSIQLTPLLYNAYVDTAESTATATSVLSNYGMMTTKMMNVTKDGTTIASYNASTQRQMYAELFTTSVYLAKMGPMFGMAANEVGKAMGELSARFHMDVHQLRPGFESVGRVAMGLGIQTSTLTSVLTKAGDQLRWFNKEGMAPVIGRFTVLGGQMLKLAGSTDKFWSKLQPGEMANLFERMADVASRIAPEQYIALRPGAAPTDVAGLAAGIEAAYTADPVSMMREMAIGLTSKLTEAGTMTQDQAFMFMSRAGMPFAEFGKSAPALLRALTSVSEDQLRGAGATGDMSKFLTFAKNAFPSQAANLEQLREQQLIVGEPLEVIKRAIVRLLAVVVQIGNAAIFGWSGTTAAAGAAESWAKMESPGTAAVNKSRGAGIR
jgi:hypothetical protein